MVDRRPMGKQTNSKRQIRQSVGRRTKRVRPQRFVRTTLDGVHFFMVPIPNTR